MPSGTTTTLDRIRSGEPQQTPAESGADRELGLAVFGTQEHGRKIVRLTSTGLEFDGTVNLEEWRDLLSAYLRVRTHFHCGLADLIDKGIEQFGRDVVEQTLCQLEFDQVDATRAFGILALDRSARRCELSSEHYWVLSQAKPPLTISQQQKWADLAVEHRLSAHQMAMSIAAGKVVAGSALGGKGRGGNMATPHGIRHAFDMYRQQVKLEELDLEAKRVVYEELKPVAEMVAKLEKEISAAGTSEHC